VIAPPFMDLRDLVRALVAGDLLAARQWVSDARRNAFVWETLHRPRGLSDLEMSVAAGVAELLAGRSGSNAPAWTAAVGGQPKPVFLDPGIETMPRTLARAKQEAPEALRKRNLFATADFLDVR
jgi:hypothetical protein